MVTRYHRLYAGAYARPDYVKDVRAMVEMFKGRYGIANRTREYDEYEPQEAPAADQPQQAQLFRTGGISGYANRTSSRATRRSPPSSGRGSGED